MKTLQKRFSQSAVTQALALACAVAAFGSPAAFADDSNFTANVSIVSSNTCQPTITLPTLNAFTQTLDISTANSTASYNGYAAPTPDAGMLTKIEMSAGCTIPSLQVVLKHTSNEAKPWSNGPSNWMTPAGTGMLFTYAEPTSFHLSDATGEDVTTDYIASSPSNLNNPLNSSDTPLTKGNYIGIPDCKNTTFGLACAGQGYLASNRTTSGYLGAKADSWINGVYAVSLDRKSAPSGNVATTATVGVAMMAGSVPRDMSGAADYFVIPNGTTIVDSYQLILSLA